MNLEAKKGWLFILPWPIEKTGGVNRVVWELSKESFKTGRYHPFICLPDWNCRSAVAQEMDFYTQIRFRVYTPAFGLRNKLTGIKSLLRLPYEIIKTMGIIKKYNIKVVNFHYVGGLTPLIYAIIKVISKVEFKLILSFHGSDILTLEKKTKLFQKLFRFILSNTDHVVCCSKGLSTQFTNLFPAFHEKVKFIHNGIADLFITESPLTKCKHNLPNGIYGRRFILSVGAFHKIKGHDILIKAFWEIRKAGSDLSLLIIGQPGPELKKTELLIKSLDLTKAVFLYQNVPPEKLISFYDAADIFVSASRYESFGLVLVEAAARKVPVVATQTMGSSEIIEHNVSGLLVEIENPEALFTAIQYLIDNPEQGRRFAENLRERVMSQFKWEHAWEKYEELTTNKPNAEPIS